MRVPCFVFLSCAKSKMTCKVYSNISSKNHTVKIFGMTVICPVWLFFLNLARDVLYLFCPIGCYCNVTSSSCSMRERKRERIRDTCIDRCIAMNDLN